MSGIRYTSDIINVQSPIPFGERERERGGWWTGGQMDGRTNRMIDIKIPYTLL